MNGMAGEEVPKARVTKEYGHEGVTAHIRFLPVPAVTAETVETLRGIDFVSSVLVEWGRIERIVTVPLSGHDVLERHVRRLVALVGESAGIAYEVDIDQFTYAHPAMLGGGGEDRRSTNLVLAADHGRIYVGDPHSMQMATEATPTERTRADRALDACIGVVTVSLLRLTGWCERVWRRRWWRI